MKILLALGLIFSALGIVAFATAPPESTPASPRFLVAFMVLFGGLSMVLLYLSLLLWRRLYKRAK